MSRLRAILRQTTLLTDLEFRKLIRQKTAYFGIVVILLLTALICVAFYLRGIKHPKEQFEGRLLTSLLNGVAFSESVLLPSIYILLPMVVGIFTAGTFAGEYQTGLIRTVCMRPVSRWSVMFSKFFAMSIYSYVLLIALMVISYLVGGLAFGFSGDVFVFGPAFLGNPKAKIFIMPADIAWQRFLLSYALAGFTLISTAAMFIMFSAIFKKMTLAVVVSLGVYYTSYIIDALPLPLLEDIHRFMPTRYINLWKYTMAPDILWTPMSHDFVFLCLYAAAYLLIAGFVFASSDA